MDIINVVLCCFFVVVFLKLILFDYSLFYLPTGKLYRKGYSKQLITHCHFPQICLDVCSYVCS